MVAIIAACSNRTALRSCRNDLSTGGAGRCGDLGAGTVGVRRGQHHAVEEGGERRPPPMPSTASAWRQPISSTSHPATGAKTVLARPPATVRTARVRYRRGGIECDEHRHRRLVQGRGHGGADHDPGQVQHRRCSARPRSRASRSSRRVNPSSARAVDRSERARRRSAVPRTRRSAARSRRLRRRRRRTTRCRG